MLLSSASRRHQAPQKTTAGKRAHKISKPSRALNSPRSKSILSKPGSVVHPKKSVSIAGIFKKPSTKELSIRSHRHKRAAPEHPLFLDYQDAVADARDITVTEAKTKISEAHSYLLSLLTDLETKNATFKESLDENADLIFLSLDEEKVETTNKTDDGSEIKETVEISKRLAAFKTAVEAKRVALAQCWTEWEDVQREIMELGIEVLGEETFGVEKKGKPAKGGLESMEEEFEKLIMAMEEEIEGIEEEFVEKMAASEKEIALRQKNERNKLLAEILAADD